VTWLTLFIVAITSVVGSSTLANWTWFALKRKTSRRLVFTTYTDGHIWSDVNGTMRPSWLTAGLTMYMHHKDMPSPNLWLFQLSEDYTEGMLTPFKTEVDKDDAGKPYPYRHVFVAETFESAKTQIECLRYGHVFRRSRSPELVN